MTKEEVRSFIADPDRLSEKEETFSALDVEGKRELIAALSGLRDERAGAFLVDLLPRETDREVQKLIRKALFRLKTMGVRVEEAPVRGEPVLRTAHERRDHRGYMSSYDVEGNRLVIIAYEVKKNNFIFVNSVTHVFHGLVDLKLLPLGKQELDRIVSGYSEGSNKSNMFVAISPPYAAFLLDEADSVVHRHAEDIRQIRQFAANLKADVREPRDLYHIPIPEETTPLPASEVLSDELFKDFTLTWDTLDADRSALASATGSAIILPPQVMQERLEKLLAGLIETDPLKAKLPLVKRLLEDYAYLYLVTGRIDCFATLMDLLKREGGPRLALAFFMSKTLEIKEPRPEDQPGLIVNPYGKIRR